MTQELDAGPVYLKWPLALDGLAEEIFIRSSRIVAQMISEIIIHEPLPQAQKGKTVKFQRRIPEQSKIPMKLKSLDEMFDHLRMLDAAEYPAAFIEHGGFRYEFSRPALRTGAIEADVRITPLKTRGENDFK
jgi:methionyl-tRNA formyltransferase